MHELLTGAAVALWVVFAVSAASKVRSAGGQRAFAESLRPLGLLPGRLLAPTALAVTGAEIAVVVGLSCAPVVRPVASAAFAVATVLLGVLTSGIALALRRGSSAPCACFGASSRPLSRRHLVRNGVLMLIAAGGAGLAAVLPPASPEPPSLVLAGLVGAVVALLLIRFDDLVELFAPTAPAGANRTARS
jgi:hypothetical protein